MAEDLLPTVVPGMVGLRNKKTKKVTNHFPVDVREIMTTAPGQYEIVDNGAVEAARLNANPLKALEADRSLMHAEVTGIEGQVLVAMTPEQAEAWKRQSESDREKPASGTAETKSEPKPEGDKAPAAAKPAATK